MAEPAGTAAGTRPAADSSPAKPVQAAEVLQRLEDERDKLSKNQVKRLRKQLAKKVKQENESSATATCLTTSSRDDDADGSLTQPPSQKRARHAPTSSDLHDHQQHHEHQQLHSGMTCSDAAQPDSSMVLGSNAQAVRQLQQWVPAVPVMPMAAVHVIAAPYAVLTAGAHSVYGVTALPAPTPLQYVPAPVLTAGEAHPGAEQEHSAVGHAQSHLGNCPLPHNPLAHSPLQHSMLPSSHLQHAALGQAHAHIPRRPPAHRRGHHVDFSAAATLIAWAGVQEPAASAAAVPGGRSSLSAGGGVARQRPCRTDLSGGVLLVSQEMEVISSGSGSRAGGQAAAVTVQAAATAQGAVSTAEADIMAGAAGTSIAVHRHHQYQQEQRQEGQQEQQQLQEQARAHAGPAGEAQEPVQQQHGRALSNKQARQRYIYGNYHSYYGLRLGHSRAEDPRVKLLDPTWFHDQDCLDIGCNEGVMTLAIATKFGTRRMTGVDIDRVLVNKASTNLAQMRTRLTQELHAPRGHDRDSEQPPTSTERRRQIKALAHTEFRHADWVELPVGPCKYDAISVFSVTKWIHLHHGDDGLMRFFHKLSRSLVPGGVLVLEPQPWKSYQNARHKQVLKEVRYAESIDQLRLRPSGFADFLTQRVGFELVCTLRVERDEAAQGFDRPILVLRRPAAEAPSDPLAALYESIDAA